jgi:hypothetical protein
MVDTLRIIAFVGMVLIEKFNEFTASDDVSDALRLLHEHYQSLGNAVAELATRNFSSWLSARLAAAGKVPLRRPVRP